MEFSGVFMISFSSKFHIA